MQNNKIKNCLVCFKKLPNENSFYHEYCCKNLFNSTKPPEISLERKEIEKLALENVNKKLVVPGVQKKLSIGITRDSKHASQKLTFVGALSGQYILKPQTNEFQFMPELEALTMQLAQICGIKVANNGLVYLSDKSLAYITKRFDRQNEKKFHCEDLCQLSEMLTEQKYKSTAEKTAKVIKKFVTFPGDELLKYFEVTLFSFIIGNADMHLKNFSLMTNEKGIVHLSPAYDLISTRLLIPIQDDNEELVLSVNGKKSNIKRKDFEFLANNIGIKEKSFHFILKNIISVKEELFILINNSYISNEMKKEYIKLIDERMSRFI
ncbi:HipA domain-containing protein [Pigmentibacter sp. JX0631]|uniref:HipA domain-containing protein n=1 Tax=Pigmentibacter sp. JX0631 TaxID=2976982 RepID=UPI0024691BD8|nr:HipA domain-containing protein [Pigmentibacter sp. JX0631]WGL60043.1 HipA domain-containing protein [Pigmentibacter sp. JX0631]